jgi:hypothetical protein
MSASLPPSEQLTVLRRWRNALLQTEPKLPSPVVDAMVHNVAQGPFGGILRQVDEGMLGLEMAVVDDLTGSEAKTIVAILTQLGRQTAELREKIQQEWDLHS